MMVRRVRRCSRIARAHRRRQCACHIRASRFRTRISPSLPRPCISTWRQAGSRPPPTTSGGSPDRILDAVTEAVSKEAADNIKSLKKAAMAEAAETHGAERVACPPICGQPPKATRPCPSRRVEGLARAALPARPACLACGGGHRRTVPDRAFFRSRTRDTRKTVGARISCGGVCVAFLTDDKASRSFP